MEIWIWNDFELNPNHDEGFCCSIPYCVVMLRSGLVKVDGQLQLAHSLLFSRITSLNFVWPFFSVFFARGWYLRKIRGR